MSVEFLSLVSLGLDEFSDISLEPNLLVSSFIVSTTFVLVFMFFSLGLSLAVETQISSVSVSV